MKFLIFLFIILISSLNSGLSDDLNIKYPSPGIISMKARVLRVIDGDTIIIEHNNESNGAQFETNYVRFLFIDTLETWNNSRLERGMLSLRSRGNTIKKSEIKKLGEMAKVSLQELLPFHQDIDLILPLTEQKDIYNRLLGLIFLNETNVNFYLVKSGLARTYFIGETGSDAVRFYKKEFKKAEKYAQKHKIGIWSVLDK